MISTERDAIVRALLIRDRKQIIDRMMDKTEILNLKHRLAEAQAGRREPGEPLH